MTREYIIYCYIVTLVEIIIFSILYITGVIAPVVTISLASMSAIIGLYREIKWIESLKD